MLKRIGSGILIVICVLVILIALGAITTPWLFRGKVFDALNNVVDAANTSIQYAQNAVGRVDALLANSQSTISTLQNSTLTIRDITADNANIQDIRQTVNTSLSNAMDQLTIYANDLKGFVANIDNTVNALSQTNLLQGSPILDQANNVLDNLQGAGQNLANYKISLDQILSNPSSLGQRTLSDVLSSPLSIISNFLGSIQTLINDIQQKLTDVQNRINNFTDRFRFWFNATSIGVTIFMLWIIFSQVMLLMRFWPTLTGRSKKAVSATS